MQACTFTLTLSAARDAVFNYLADIENLPHWAPETCESVRLHRGGWLALTSRGELVVQLSADAVTGVIDLRAGPESGLATPLPIRVLALDERRTLVLFTFVPPPELGAARFADELVRHQRELRAFANRFGGAIHVPDLPELLAHGRN